MVDKSYFSMYNRYIKTKNEAHNKDRGNLFRAGEAADVRWVRFLENGGWANGLISLILNSMKPLHSVYIDVTRGAGGI